MFLTAQSQIRSTICIGQDGFLNFIESRYCQRSQLCATAPNLGRRCKSVQLDLRLNQEIWVTSGSETTGAALDIAGLRACGVSWRNPRAHS
jgi:hypothetical protein